MIKSMFSGVTGLRGHQTMMDVIGNNIANVNTVGFKASRVVFTDVFYQTLRAASAAVLEPGGAGGINASQIGYGAQVSSIDVLNTQGSYMQTDKTTDLYISGEGYFIVGNDASDICYTRVGNFSFDAYGYLVDGRGNHILGASAIYEIDPDTIEYGEDPVTGDPVPIDGSGQNRVVAGSGILANADRYGDPPDLNNLVAIQINRNDYSNVTIADDGKISGINNATGSIEILGQIALATFANADGLSQSGGMYMKVTPNSGAAFVSAPNSVYTGALQSSGLEMSNVDLSRQFTDMIVAQRGFQANSRVITTSDEILQELVNLKR